MFKFKNAKAKQSKLPEYNVRDTFWRLWISIITRTEFRGSGCDQTESLKFLVQPSAGTTRFLNSNFLKIKTQNVNFHPNVNPPIWSTPPTPFWTNTPLFTWTNPHLKNHPPPEKPSPKWTSPLTWTDPPLQINNYVLKRRKYFKCAEICISIIDYDLFAIDFNAFVNNN